MLNFICVNFLVVLQGILECQNQLKKDVNSEVEFPNNILEAFGSLISSLYNLSRRDAMRSEIGKRFFFCINRYLLTTNYNVLFFNC